MEATNCAFKTQPALSNFQIVIIVLLTHNQLFALAVQMDTIIPMPTAARHALFKFQIARLAALRRPMQLEVK
jgi:hypothetical protein